MKKLLFTLLLLSFNCVLAQSFDFNKTGEDSSNEIMIDFVKKEIPDFRGNVCSYFYDIDNDSEKEILGIVKSKIFYTLQGYKLVILKKENGTWNILNSNIYFDPEKNIEITNKQLIYYGTSFYDNKKYTAKIKKNEIISNQKINDYFTNKKVKNIENVLEFSQNENKNIRQITDFSVDQQRNVDINYKNLNEKTKHYLNIK